ncbi:hypothetical protein SAY86_004762 [Trapa natans]|uniref:Cystatin domain-containing protein n=1 Tax=Trapa natans TaxID=22666 RepID=A0AAN7MF12_TRANT|nr:hypothetical protein SAY86_004762 [Trapa natans]
MGALSRRSSLILLQMVAVVSILSVAPLAGGGRGLLLLGGWQPIKDIKDPHIKEIGRFAVNEYNNQTSASLRFKKVMSGESQVVAGMNYRLIIAAKDGKTTRNYEAVVWDKPWEHFRQLTSFKPVTH